MWVNFPRAENKYRLKLGKLPKPAVLFSLLSSNVCLVQHVSQCAWGRRQLNQTGDQDFFFFFFFFKSLRSRDVFCDGGSEEVLQKRLPLKRSFMSSGFLSLLVG